MTALGFYWPRNHGQKLDGDHFAREAQHWADAQDGVEDVRLYGVGGRKPVNRALICGAIEAHAPVARVAIFCHGWNNKIQGSFMVNDDSIDELADALREHGTYDVRVTLYCCSTAHDRDDIDEPLDKIDDATAGGFAWELARRIGPGAQVDAHLFAGHTTRAPQVVRFRCGDDGDVVASWLVAPGSEFWGRWRVALTDDADLRYRYSLMTEDEIAYRLSDK